MAAPTARSFLGTFALVFISIALLFVADTFLAKGERTESMADASRLYDEARALMARGDNAAAIDKIKDAIGIERGNRDYQRALAEAQLAAGKPAAAEATLKELLQSDATDGPANLIMGRVLVKEGHLTEAISHFHSAIYGHWGESTTEKRLAVRFELIELLAQNNLKQDLLAELLPVQEQAPHDLKTRTRIGRLFLLADSPSRAADVFRELLREVPTDPDAYSGLGEAEFARGNYRAAQRDFQAALRFNPEDQVTKQHLELCNELRVLDPTVRGLARSERFRRSIKLVELTVEDATQCIGPKPPADVQALLDQAGKTLKAHVSSAGQSEASESNLDLAEQLWAARRRECKAPPNMNSPSALVLSKIAQ